MTDYLYQFSHNTEIGSWSWVGEGLRAKREKLAENTNLSFHHSHTSFLLFDVSQDLLGCF